MNYLKGVKMAERKILGYNGKILRVKLSERSVVAEEWPVHFYQSFLGGRGFIAPTLLREMKKGCDPLGPDNKLIFSLGPLTGMPLPGTARNSVGAKSPLTGGFGEAEAGGFWGAELKKAGFDMIIVEGISEKPVYLHINNGDAQLRDASHLWGMEVADTHKAIQKELGDDRVRTAIIGPGGERCVFFACILNDIDHAAGRTGLGAVMGSKKLKAIAVRGQELPAIANMEAVKELGRWMAKNYKEVTAVWRFGTGYAVEAYSKEGNLPTCNFRDGSFDGASKISARTLSETYGIGMYGCYACPVKCKKKVKIDEPGCCVDPIYGGPEYETLAAFGSNCGISDLKAICKAHEICNRNGIDTISAGCTIAFAMECFEAGLLTIKDTDGVDLTFGNAQSMLKVLEMIVQQKGIGALLAKGSRIAARNIGRGADDYAIQVKGLELAMHDPRVKKGFGINLGVNPAGPDHASSIQDMTLMEGQRYEDWNSIDANDPIPVKELSPRKARQVYQYGMWTHLANYLGWCIFVRYSPKQISEAVEAVTGWSMSLWRLMKTAERGLTLSKIFNLREGFTEADDVLPMRMRKPQSKGDKEAHIDPALFDEAKRYYYYMLGWDEQGVPTRMRLVELDIEWAAHYLS